MVLERTITKNLAGEQDLLLGEGVVSQERQSGSRNIDKLNVAKWVADSTALASLNTTYFIRARLGSNSIGYRWAEGDLQSPNGATIIAGVGGNWLTTNIVAPTNTTLFVASVPVDSTAGNIVVFEVPIANVGTAFFFQNPTNAVIGQTITIIIRNTSGAPLGVITWDTDYMPGTITPPATGLSVAIDFTFDGFNWVGR